MGGNMDNNLINRIQERWTKVMENITIGFAMTIITLNFWGLQYILPSIGVVLIYLGFSELKEENKALKVAWICSIINMVLNIGKLICVSTPLHLQTNYFGIVVAIQSMFQLTFLIIFRHGVKEIFNKINEKQTRDPILALIVWNIIGLACAATHLGQVWLIALVVVIGYLYSLKSIYRLKYDFEKINYIPMEATKRFTVKRFTYVYMLVCIITMGICCVLFNHIKLDAREATPMGLYEVRKSLIKQGFPEDILESISNDDVSILKNPIYIENFMEVLDFNSYNNMAFKNIDSNNLLVTTIFIESSNNEMYAIEYFEGVGVDLYWNTGFNISASQPIELINGNLLYEDKGISYIAPIPRLKCGLVVNDDLFGSESEEEKITGAISYPFGTTNQRGYVLYKLNITDDTIYGSNIVNYIHYKYPFRLPYVELEKNNAMFDNNVRQHCTNFQTNKRREIDKGL